ncbi:HAMP domain-containing histidine kinase [Massilia sp. PAMC28688]|uniref:sensor histidine kinase n=1 Tax=Massilia sp. PAMC28688 TaxID=2861283 RepID=UPI001C6366BD|nr:HAMP domain-containing sensor histidine kinase [Massilia sp. PAMC28688]QYF95117.1 HAMP domain-containing histidine kinase [Massilia sp. PAMC28688]
MKFHGSLRRQMALACVLVALVAALCFSALGLMFVYVIEDSFIDNMLEQEMAHLQQTGAPPILPFVTVYRDTAAYPDDLAPGALVGEFAGDEGRHYHVRTLTLADGSTRHLVAEVSRQLVVRPRVGYILRFLGVATLILLLVTGALGYWLARRASAPLLALTRVVSGALPGQLPRGFAHQFPDNEIGTLARTLDDAMARLDGFITREQHFTRDASHELRTPLTVIDGAAELLAAQPLPSQAQAQLQRIRQACSHMTQCVDTLLALAREELGHTPVLALPLLPLLERVILDHAHLLGERPVDVVVQVPPSAVMNSRGASLAMLLANLVSNAFIHTLHGTVRISFAHHTLVVEDSGAGLAPELDQRLFQPGVKGEHSIGAGLGLSIASRLALLSGMTLALGPGAAGGTRASLRQTQH